jgi:hypothetical protein
LLLGHELAHADTNFFGFIYRRMLHRGVPDYDNLEERRVITGPEADAARTLGEGTRTDHRGGLYITPNPITVDPAPSTNYGPIEFP